MSGASYLHRLFISRKGLTMCNDRLEPNELPALKPGRCNWCGAKTIRDVRNKRMKYCSGTNCRVKYNNLLTKQGKALMDMLKIWRKHRGAKGTPGEGMIGHITTRLDGMLDKDRQRVAELTAVRVLREMAEGHNAPREVTKAVLGELRGAPDVLAEAVRKIARGVEDARGTASAALRAMA